jgi:hypothetical protein
MNNENDELDDRLLHHLEELDRVSRDPARISPQRYETLITYAWRKRLAAQYHLTNVESLLGEDATEHQKADRLLEGMAKSHLADGSRIDASVEFRNATNHYAYELSAFLEALKSSVDIAAEAVAMAVPGVSANYSITPLLKAAVSPTRNTVLAVIQDYRHWLEALREYRHHLVHRLMPSLQSGYRAESRDGIRASSPLPVVVPQRTPSYVPDTRESRSHHDDEAPPKGLELLTGTASVKIGDARQKLLHFELRARPAQGYVPIQQFMREHLDTHEKFFASLLKAVEVDAFKDPSA